MENMQAAYFFGDMMTTAKDPSDFVFSPVLWVSGGAAEPSDHRDMSIDGSTTPAVYEFEASARMDLHRVNFYLHDGSVEPRDFGGITGGLSAGLQIEIIDADGSTVLKSFTSVYKIKQNANFIALAGVDALPQNYVGDDILAVRWTIAKAGAPMRLKEGQRFRVTVNDDLTAITEFRMMVQGIKN